MYPACKDCVINKGFLFPVEKERVEPGLNSYGSARLYIEEKPLLLDPCLDNPADHLEFCDNGRVKAKDDSKRGHESITVLQLNREKLVNARKKHAEDLNNLLRSGLNLLSESKGTLIAEVEVIVKQLIASCEARQPFAGMKRQLLHGWLQSEILSLDTSQEIVSALKKMPWKNLIDQLNEWLNEPVLIRKLLLKLYSCQEKDLEILCQSVSLNVPKPQDETTTKFIHNIITESQKQKKLDDVLEWIGSQPRRDVVPVIVQPPLPEPSSSRLFVRDRWALLVGINHYVDPSFPDLRFCVNDVLALEAQLKMLGYTVIALHDMQTEEHRIPTRDNVEAELTRVCEAARKDDLIFVHFACHGKLVNAQPVLLTRETRAPMLPQRALPLSIVEQKMRSSMARQLVLTLDACHVGIGSGRSLTPPAFIHDASKYAEGFALIAASTSQQIAQEWQEKQHGAFTYYLLEGIRGEADYDKKKYVTVDDLKNFVIDRLHKWNVVHGGPLQEPTANTKGVEDIIVADYRNRNDPQPLQPLVFVSYSHRDEKEKEALLQHLRVLENVGLLFTWSDNRIGAGDDWKNEIRNAMDRARVAILLISSNFLTSRFILDTEVPTLLQRRESGGLTVIPVIARACAWKRVEWLARMNVRPKNGRPIWGEEGSGRVDEDLTIIAEEVAAILDTRKMF
jgi:hypothetical protein